MRWAWDPIVRRDGERKTIVYEFLLPRPNGLTATTIDWEDEERDG